MTNLPNDINNNQANKPLADITNNPIKKYSYLNALSNLVLILLCFLLILKIFVYQQVNVDGLSMYPNYNDKDFLVMNLVDKNFHRGQVMAVYAIGIFTIKFCHV